MFTIIFPLDKNGFSIKETVVVGLENEDKDDLIQFAEVKLIFSLTEDPDNFFILCEFLQNIEYEPCYVSYRIEYTNQFKIVPLQQICDQVSYVARDQKGASFVDWA